MAAASLLTDIMRILTPEEISELTSTSSGSSRVQLTDMLDLYETGQELPDPENMGAKILPFNKEEIDLEIEVIYEAGPHVIETIQNYLKKLSLGNTALSKEGKAVETSTFILNEKERFEYVQAKLKKQEVMGLYMKNATVDIEQEKALKDDLKKSSRSGVLVNKKQF